MLIRRNVLEKMAAKHPELRYEHSFTGDKAATADDVSHLYALFDTSLDRDQGPYLPEDYTFCNRWRAMGGEIWSMFAASSRMSAAMRFKGTFRLI